MLTFYITAATALLILLNATLAAFEQCIVKLRYRLLTGDEFADALNKMPLKRVRLHAETIARSVRLMQSAFYIAFGVFIYALIRMVSNADEPVHTGRLVFTLVAALLIHYIAVFLLSRFLVVRHPLITLKTTAWFILILQILLSPLFSSLIKLERILFKRTQELDTGNLDDFDSEVQIRALARDDLVIKPILRNIICNTLMMSELELSDVLLPRAKVQYLNIHDSIADNLEKARRAGHTRFPLCEGDLDKCIGIVHIKDLFRLGKHAETVNLRKVRRNIISLSINEPVDEALQKLLRRKMHMALVTEEFGGTVGVVTLESILEELVGDILDEFDVDESLIREVGQNRYRVSGLTPIHEMEEVMDIEIDTDEVSTFGGLVTSEIGRIPMQGEILRLDEYQLEVTVDEVDEKRIISALVEKLIGAESTDFTD